MKCKCGNPEMGFDCVCDWVKKHPGEREFSCEICGLYDASEPRCNKCEDTTRFLAREDKVYNNLT
jgi:hypothetical protein